MKLPSESCKEGEQQSASPSTDSSSSREAEGASGSSSSPSTSSSGTVDESERNAQAASTATASQEVDFSEYLWMENEEEFDSQVLQELEDEEMINYYYELYEASLNENGTWGPTTANLRVTDQPPPYAPDGARGPQPDDAIESLAQGISSRLNFGTGSRLNPEAAEFVPRTTNMTSPN